MMHTVVDIDKKRVTDKRSQEKGGQSKDNKRHKKMEIHWIPLNTNSVTTNRFLNIKMIDSNIFESSVTMSARLQRTVFLVSFPSCKRDPMYKQRDVT